MLAFSGVLVGTGEVWLVLPVSLVIGVVVFRYILWRPQEQSPLSPRVRRLAWTDRDELLAALRAHARAASPRGGLLGLGLFGVDPKTKAEAGTYRPLRVTVPGDGGEATQKVRAADLVFASGPHADDAGNGRQALRLGAIGAALFVMIYAMPEFALSRGGETFPLLRFLLSAVSIGGYWLFGAFFLGYFYTSLRGTNGWQKGAWLALAISLATVPMQLLQAQSASDYAVVLIAVGQRLAFFVLLGIFAFDLATYRQGSDRPTDWGAFTRITGISAFQAVLSVIVAAIGVAVSTVVTGQLTAVLGDVAATLLPAAATVEGIAP